MDNQQLQDRAERGQEMMEAEGELRLALLRQILSQVPQAVGSRELLDLAEAFAWTMNPGQGHGSRS